MSTVVACPDCKQSLTLPPDMVGKKVRCPGCAGIFVAGGDALKATAPPPAPPVADVPEWEKPRPGSDEEFAAPLEEEDEERTARKRKKKKKGGGGYYEELLRQQRRRMEPHRGVLILILGILGLTCTGICGIFAWVMGTNDLNEMYSGRMDPEGETLTNVGRILGMVSICLNILGIAACCSCGILSAVRG